MGEGALANLGTLPFVLLVDFVVIKQVVTNIPLPFGLGVARSHAWKPVLLHWGAIIRQQNSSRAPDSIKTLL